MQQRLALAQSLVTEPKVLLLDEPFGALDPGIRADMQRLVRRLWERTGTTVFMVTHDLPEAFSLGTRLLVFDRERRDPDYPHAYGSRITYDIPLERASRRELAELESLIEAEERHAAEA
jgi:NitT/TauT family transport system ATP-binding protein